MDGEAQIEDGVFVEWNNREGDINSSQSEDRDEAAQKDPTRTVVTPDGWRFTCSTIGKHELYNLNLDPMEIDNLARSKRYVDLMSDLLETIRGWQRRTGDHIRLSNSF